MKRTLILTMLMLALALPALALVPETMNVQGVLSSNTGVVLPDGDYEIFFQLWDAAVDGSDSWGETQIVHQEGGVFNAILGAHGQGLPPQEFAQRVWLSITVEGEMEMEPRIELTSSPYAFRAATVDPNAAVRKLNGMTNNINLVGGANVTVTQVDTTLVIAATAGAGGDDGDWEMDGQDVYHPDGRVKIGLYPPAALNEGFPPARDAEAGKTTIDGSKLAVKAYSEGIYSTMIDIDTLADDRHALFAKRQGSGTTPNHGTGYGVFETNTAVTGYNDWGHSYTFGVAGYTWFDFSYTGGVLGSNNSGTYWGSLAYRDGNGFYWGMYTPNSLYVGQLTRTFALQVLDGASSGYILTSDSSGNASWQPPSTAQSDGDWTISGNDLFHSGYGTVAIGTTTPTPLIDAGLGTALQINSYAMPTLCLDRTVGNFERWAIYNAGDGLRIGRTEVADQFPTSGMLITDTVTEFLDNNGDTLIKLSTADVDQTGSQLSLWSTSPYTTAPMLTLDSQSNSSNYGGSLTVRDQAGEVEVVVTGNYNNTHVGRVITPVLEITGGSDLSEQFDIGNTSLLPEPGMVVSIDPDQPGHLTLCEAAYDRRVAGVISGAGGVNTGLMMGQTDSKADGEHPVALVGRVYVWADASHGPIEPGDLLTTSDLPGHAMKVEDHGRAMGAILGKAMTGLTEGQGLILTLVSLQ